MSYAFNMCFVDHPVITEGEAYAWFIEMVRKLMADTSITSAMLNDNRYYIGNCLRRIGITESNAPERKHDAGLAFEYAVEQIFKFNAVYWPEHQLLGFVMGDDIPEHLNEDVTSVYFQNSCDQDYEFDVWSNNIALFKQMKDSVQSATETELRGNDWDYSDLDYIRRSVLYQRIYAALKLDSWLYGKEEPETFLRFSVNGLVSSEQRMDFALKARALFRLWFKPITESNKN